MADDELIQYLRDQTSTPLMWSLVHYEDTTPLKKRVVGDFRTPTEGMLAGDAYASQTLVWGTSPEGHLHAIIPYEKGSVMPSQSLMLHNPYYAFWRVMKQSADVFASMSAFERSL